MLEVLKIVLIVVGVLVVMAMGIIMKMGSIVSIEEEKELRNDRKKAV